MRLGKVIVLISKQSYTGFMSIDPISAVIFGLFAVLIFKNSFSIKFTMLLAIFLNYTLLPSLTH